MQCGIHCVPNRDRWYEALLGPGTNEVVWARARLHFFQVDHGCTKMEENPRMHYILTPKLHVISFMPFSSIHAD